MKPDDPTVAGSDGLYRHSPTVPRNGWITYDEGDGSHRVQQGAFIWDEDGISTYLDSALESEGLTWSSVKRDPRNGVFRLRVADVRTSELGAARDPNPPYISDEDRHPRDCAHSLIVAPDSMSKTQRGKKRRDLARHAEIIDFGDPPPQLPPPTS